MINTKDIQMYFNEEVVEDFAKHEQNDKNFKVAEIVDKVIMKFVGEINENFLAVELGGGAHPDRYHNLFEAIISGKGKIDRVDISPYMLNLAKKYIDTDIYRKRLDVIDFVEKDIISYLLGCDEQSLDLAIMKYTIDHIYDLDELFKLLYVSLKKGGILVSSIGGLSSKLKSISTNARFLYNGEEFPEDEFKDMSDGDSFTVKFFSESGNPEGGFIPGAETTKYFHSREKIETLAKKYGFDIQVGDQKEILQNDDISMDQDVLVLIKK